METLSECWGNPIDYKLLEILSNWDNKELIPNFYYSIGEIRISLWNWYCFLNCQIKIIFIKIKKGNTLLIDIFFKRVLRGANTFLVHNHCLEPKISKCFFANIQNYSLIRFQNPNKKIKFSNNQLHLNKKIDSNFIIFNVWW